MSILDPVLLSIKVASLATLLTLIVGVSLARLFTVRRIVFRRFWETLILLPMVFPPTITGYLLLLFFGVHGPGGALLAELGIDLVFTWPAAVLASSLVSLPLMYQSCRTAFTGIDAQYANAARTLGASERRIFWRITLPLASPGIIGGVALAFARALGEFGATLMIAGNIPGVTRTIPLALYSAVESGRTDEANILLGITVGISFVVVAVLGWSERKVVRSRQGGGG